MLTLPDEFVVICQEILGRNLTEAEWAEVESDDEFQTKRFAGGFDATEMAFCFRYYDDARREFWFQLTLGEIEKVVEGTRTTVDHRRAG